MNTIPINLLEDGAFKSLCTSIEARKVVSEVVSIITGIDYNLIYKAKFIGGELPKQNINEKKKASDLIIDVSNDLKIILEMNQFPSKNIFKKSLYFLSKHKLKIPKIKPNGFIEIDTKSESMRGKTSSSLVP